MKDSNGMELTRSKRLKQISSNAFMEETANANLILKASSNVAVTG